MNWFDKLPRADYAPQHMSVEEVERTSLHSNHNNRPLNPDPGPSSGDTPSGRYDAEKAAALEQDVDETLAAARTRKSVELGSSQAEREREQEIAQARQLAAANPDANITHHQLKDGTVVSL